MKGRYYNPDRRKSSSAKYLVIAITPKSSSYKITITNTGTDTVNKVNTTLKLYDVNGNYLTSYSKTLTKVKVGLTSYTWEIAKQNTVEETIRLSGTASDGVQTIKLMGGSTVRYNFAGGRFGTMKPLGGHRHHMPSKSALTATSKVSSTTGPCIRMIIADHKQTASYGNYTSASNFRAKEKKLVKNEKLLAAQKLGIYDVQNLFEKKYNSAINNMVKYTKATFDFKK